ncbi:MAG TPA: RNA-binding protein hfq [Coleofasciculaceae cyanobacterium]|jgi:host factor-I protein
MAEFETGLPSVRQVQVFIKEGQQVELKLLTQDLLTGQLTWQDQNCVCLITQDEQPMVIWRHAIAYIKPQTVIGST